jgi:O-antigen/teichoic acid export membrane protein
LQPRLSRIGRDYTPARGDPTDQVARIVVELSPADAEEALEQAGPSDILDTDAAGGLIIRGGTVRVFGYVVGLALSVIGISLLTRHLGVGKYGQYITVLSLVTVVGAVTDAGMGGLGTREFAVTHGAERDRLMRDLLGLRLALTAVGSLFAIGFALIVGYSAALVAGTVLACLGLVAMVTQTMYAVPLAASLQLGWMTTLDFMRQVFTVAAIVALVLVEAPLIAFLAIGLPVNALLTVLTIRRVRGRMPLSPSLHVRGWVALLRSTIAFAMAMAVGTVYVYTAQVLTSLVASEHQNGLFAVSFRVFIVLVAIPGLLVGAAFPLLARAARDDRDRLGYAVERLFEVSIILGGAAAIGIAIGAPAIIAVVGGPKYAAAASALRIQGLALGVSFTLATWGFALLSLRDHRGLIVTNALALAVSCALTLGLASRYGARGAAFATLGGELTLAIGYLVCLVRRGPELRPRLPIVGKVAVAAAPAALLGAFAGLPSAAAAIVALALYALVLLLVRAVPSEVWILVRPRGDGAGIG